MAFTASNQRELLAALHRLAANREAAERETLGEFDAANVRARRDLSDARQAAIMRFQLDRDATQRDYDAVLARAESEFIAGHTDAEKVLQRSTAAAQADFAAVERQIQEELTERKWEANTVFEATHTGPQLQLQQDETQIAMIGDSLQQIQDQSDGYLAASRLGHLQTELLPRAQPSPFAAEDANSRLNRRLQEAADHFQDMKSRMLPRMLRGGTPLAIAVAIWIVVCALTFLSISRHTSSWLIVGTIISLAIVAGGGVWLFAMAGASISAPYRALQAAIAEARELRRLALDQARHRAAAETWRITQRRDSDLRAAEQHFHARIGEITARRDGLVQAAREQYGQSERELSGRRDNTVADAHATYPRRLDEFQQRYQAELRTAQEQFDAAVADADARRNSAWASLLSTWTDGAAKIRGAIEGSNVAEQKLFPTWDDPNWNTWQPPTAVPPAIQFGKIHVDLASVPGAISADSKLNGMIPDQFDLAALLPFPRNGSLLWKASGQGRQRAIEALQAVMLRMLTTIPPGKIRFTIIDPVGLGENFAGFMHLADHDEQLVNGRIWTDPQQIEKRLADLTEQMENVIQKYLRNEFRSIDEYNASAGEVAEPFRVLVVANFPVNFTETAARRLTSIVTTGARCGVYTLIVHDVNQPLPPHFDLAEIERNALTLEWTGDHFAWRDAAYEKYPLRLDKPPVEELFTRLVQAVGRAAKDSKRVEVPFDFVAPPPEKWWTGDTAKGIRVPLGRAGATKLQYLTLGEGTAQHVLVAGKTGSGKSTLLHALVTNTALIYGPDQVQLYLIDFKKGVEFKTYATHRLPHARVIAIESEREFGLSVLEKLDAELRRRGDVLRSAGVQDLAAYREVAGPQSLPRILLVVDEFQELFTEDDKLAQDAALLLDRLVRQGRAFGMHVLLGSQTLGGAYSLVRSTMGQMTVRIALQCSEADAHLILSEENSAARLLSRPGEAIYNDANGLVQGNNPFQVVWLSDQRREHYLESLQSLSEQRLPSIDQRPSAPIVFEGNQPADLEHNRLLIDLVRSNDWPVQSTPIHAWLGDAIAIKDPTAAVFRPQSGANLLIVGGRETTVMGMLAASMLSIAAQHRPSPARPRSTGPSGYSAGSVARFYVLEHDRPADLPVDRPLADYRSGLGAFGSVLPHSLQSAGRRDLPALISEVAVEVQRRLVADDKQGPATYLFIADLGRFRDLRRDESDFFGSSDKPATPAQMLAMILRDGPSVGIYTLAWCDSLAAVNRALDRHALREFAFRVLMQMSANDSSQLVDVPIASRLGPHAAIFQNEEEGRLEKFRPYAWPAAGLLAQLQNRFNARMAAAKD